MYIRQLLAVAALLLIGANSMPQPQGDLTATATEAGVLGPPTGTSSGGGEHRPGSWKEFMGMHHSHEGPPPGVGPAGAGESTVPSATPETPTTAGNSTDSTDSTGGGAAASSSAPAAATSVASDKLRRAVLF